MQTEKIDSVLADTILGEALCQRIFSLFSFKQIINSQEQNVK